MPTKVEYYQIFPDGEAPLTPEYSTKEAAEAEVKRLEVETGKKYDVWAADRWMPIEGEDTTRVMYLLTREDCNGEFGTTGHRSLHESIDGAKAMQTKLVDPQDLKGEDAINEWRPEPYDETSGALQFRTGNWGYVCWEIRPLKVLP